MGCTAKPAAVTVPVVAIPSTVTRTVNGSTAMAGSKVPLTRGRKLVTVPVGPNAIRLGPVVV